MEQRTLVNGISFETIYKKVEEIFSLLENVGIIVNKQCRFYKFREKLLAETSGDYKLVVNHNIDGDFLSIPIDLSKILNRATTLGEGIRDFFELWAIVSSKTIMRDNLNELKQIFGGNVDLFQDKAANTKARDLQYQLYLTALFELSGIDVENSEPDFKFNYLNEIFSVACKRISSQNKIYKRIKQAEKQILQNGERGFIAISLDRLVGLNFHSSTTDINRLNDEALEMIYGLMDKSFPDRLPDLNENILGIIASLNKIGIDMMTGQIGFAHPSIVLIYDRGDKDMNTKIIELTKKVSIDMRKLI
jgi:hypothetical protein